MAACAECGKMMNDDACSDAQCCGATAKPCSYALRAVFCDGKKSDRIDDFKDHDGMPNLNLLAITAIGTVPGGASTKPAPGWKCYDGCQQIGRMVQERKPAHSPLPTAPYGNAGPGARVCYTVVKPGVSVFRECTAIRRTMQNMQDVTEDRVIHIFQTHIRSKINFGSRYAKLRVAGVRKTGNCSDALYYIAVAGEGQHWCLNCAADHSDSFIFFECRKNGMCQRCLSPDKTPEGPHRKSGICRDFRSARRALNRPDREFLFPTEVGYSTPALPGSTLSHTTSTGRATKQARVR
tara:strand:- start:533 stop:1414 length:882 start_codon:yes stop_codon:yes gene_type:complete